ncbi:MAG: c-type cytochrome [Anaeromyxobacteraceae bacterium]
MNRSLKILIAVFVLVPAAPALAQGGAFTPEDMIRMRQGLMLAQKTQVGLLADWAKHAAAPDERAASWAANLAAIARVVPIGFGEASQDTTAVKTAAKPEIWKNAAEFKTRLAALQTETAKLAEVAKKKDGPGFAQQYAATTATCKACHDAFRRE